MKKIMLTLIIGIFLLSFMGASIPHLGGVQQGECIILKQTCATCTYNNISRIIVNPSSSIVLEDVAMTRDGTFYNYSFCNTTLLGEYQVDGFGDYIGGVLTTWNYEFDVTPSGFKGVLGLFIILIVGAYAIGFIGFFGKHEWVSVLGGLTMMLLGIYIARYGLDAYRNFMTIGFSYFTIGLGGLFTLVPLIEMIRGNY